MNVKREYGEEIELELLYRRWRPNSLPKCHICGEWGHHSCSTDIPDCERLEVLWTGVVRL